MPSHGPRVTHQFSALYAAASFTICQRHPFGLNAKHQKVYGEGKGRASHQNNGENHNYHGHYDHWYGDYNEDDDQAGGRRLHGSQHRSESCRSRERGDILLWIYFEIYFEFTLNILWIYFTF